MDSNGISKVNSPNVTNIDKPHHDEQLTTETNGSYKCYSVITQSNVEPDIKATYKVDDIATKTKLALTRLIKKTNDNLTAVAQQDHITATTRKAPSTTDVEPDYKTLLETNPENIKFGRDYLFTDKKAASDFQKNIAHDRFYGHWFKKRDSTLSNDIMNYMHNLGNESYPNRIGKWFTDILALNFTPDNPKEVNAARKNEVIQILKDTQLNLAKTVSKLITLPENTNYYEAQYCSSIPEEQDKTPQSLPSYYTSNYSKITVAPEHKWLLNDL